MTITIYQNGEVFVPNKLIGFEGETNYRSINFEYSSVAGAAGYKLRLLYNDGLIYELPIINGAAAVGGSVLREAGKIQAQWIAYAMDELSEEYELVAKSKVFELIIGSSIGDDISEIPTYEAIVAAAVQLVEDGMTKEEVITAIQQIVETGEVQDLDTGFITTLKEIHNGAGFKVWLGTTAEYNVLEAGNALEPNTLYIRTDDNTLRFPGAMDPTKSLAAIISEAGSFMLYRLTAVTNTDIYPETVTPGSQSSNAATVAYFSSGSSGFFLFSYSGNVYINTFYASAAEGGYTFSGWIRLTQTDSGWIPLTISGTGFTAGSAAPQYRRIGSRVYIRGQIVVDMDNVVDVTTVFATLPEGFRPSAAKYQLLAGEGDRMARLYVRTGGGININYFKEYAGATVTGSHWLQLDCEFLTD